MDGIRPFRWLAVAVLVGACGGSTSNPPDAGVSAQCGNGVAEPGEDCDGEDLRGKSCSEFGFNSGDLVCHAECVFDLRGCASVEICDNGDDDDGDSDKDCDASDCAGSVACEVCGDGQITGDEQCEDGNTTAGDCCDASCHAEAGCELEPNDSTAT